MVQLRTSHKRGCMRMHARSVARIGAQKGDRAMGARARGAHACGHTRTHARASTHTHTHTHSRTHTLISGRDRTQRAAKAEQLRQKAQSDRDNCEAQMTKLRQATIAHARRRIWAVCICVWSAQDLLDERDQRKAMVSQARPAMLRRLSWVVRAQVSQMVFVLSRSVHVAGGQVWQ